MPKDKRRTECDSKDSAKFRSLSGEKWRCSEQRFSEAHVGGMSYSMQHLLYAICRESIKKRR